VSPYSCGSATLIGGCGISGALSGALRMESQSIPLPPPAAITGELCACFSPVTSRASSPRVVLPHATRIVKAAGWRKWASIFFLYILNLIFICGTNSTPIPADLTYCTPVAQNQIYMYIWLPTYLYIQLILRNKEPIQRIK